MLKNVIRIVGYIRNTIEIKSGKNKLIIFEFCILYINDKMVNRLLELEDLCGIFGHNHACCLILLRKVLLVFCLREKE